MKKLHGALFYFLIREAAEDFLEVEVITMDILVEKQHSTSEVGHWIAKCIAFDYYC